MGYNSKGTVSKSQGVNKFSKCDHSNFSSFWDGLYALLVYIQGFLSIFNSNNVAKRNSLLGKRLSKQCDTLSREGQWTQDLSKRRKPEGYSRYSTSLPKT